MEYEIIREHATIVREVIGTVTLGNPVGYDAFAEQAEARGYTLRRVE